MDSSEKSSTAVASITQLVQSYHETKDNKCLAQKWHTMQLQIKFGKAIQCDSFIEIEIYNFSWICFNHITMNRRNSRIINLTLGQTLIGVTNFKSCPDILRFSLAFPCPEFHRGTPT